MKTLESIMKSNAKKSDSSSFMYSPRKCDDCGILEGSEDSELGTTVYLTSIRSNDKTKLVCKACKKLYLVNREKQKKSIMEKVRTYLAALFGVFIIVSIISINGFAESNLLHDPSQAQIGKGLGWLTAEGDVYHIRNKASREIEN